MSKDSKPPALIVGRILLNQDQEPALRSLNPDHREATLLYQQKVAALIEAARDYAHDPGSARTVTELLRVAGAFAENA